MDKNNLRREYGNETGDKIRVEMFVTYNNNYVKWLEEKLVKLLTIPSVTQRTYKCFDCKNYDIQTGNIRGSVNRICNKIKNDPRIIVDLDAPNCNDYEYGG